jgi:hypothetical protein
MCDAYEARLMEQLDTKTANAAACPRVKLKFNILRSNSADSLQQTILGNRKQNRTEKQSRIFAETPFSAIPQIPLEPESAEASLLFKSAS